MIKAILRRPDGSPIYLFGLSEENVKRLKDNKPIVFDGAVIGLRGEFCIMYGATEEIIRASVLALGEKPPGVRES